MSDNWVAHGMRLAHKIRYNAKLTPQDARQIFVRYWRGGEIGLRLAEEFEVSDTVIYSITTRRGWAFDTFDLRHLMHKRGTP